MQIHDIKRLHKSKKDKTVGRGGKRGKTSGKGTKGQNARAGRKFRPAMRDMIKKLPKLRGYKFASRNIKPSVVNLAVLNEAFETGAKITPEVIFEKGLVRKVGGKIPKIKILAQGEISKSVTVAGCTVSVAAKLKIETAGGTVTV